MRLVSTIFAATFLMSGTALAQVQKVALPATVEDPYQWLEEVEAPRALDWVKDKNKTTLSVLEAAPNFEKYRNQAFAILNDKRRIAYGNILGNEVTNFWQDEKSVRGGWRKADIKSYLSGIPAWKTLLDMDALAAAEGKNWVWKGADCRAPDYRYCLVSLSNGGKDAVEVREFDTQTMQFVTGGFVVPEAKNRVSWWDKDTLVVGTNYGPGTMTDSGYPRQLKLWKRGTPLSAAKPLYEVATTDVWTDAVVSIEKNRTDRMLLKGMTFWTGQMFHVLKDGTQMKWPLPDDADFKDLSGGRVYALMRTDWNGFPKGSLVSYAVDDHVKKRKNALELVFAPGAGMSIEGVTVARTKVYVTLLDNVKGKLAAFTRTRIGWQVEDIAMPANGTLAVTSVAKNSDLAFVNFNSFTTPSSLYVIDGEKYFPAQTVSAFTGNIKAISSTSQTYDETPAKQKSSALDAKQPRLFASLPARFDGAKYDVTQRFATSKDGTKIPYFLIRPKGATGPLPTLQYGYGGFELSQTANYVGPLGQFWIEEGGAYIMANIRGGGEYGPAWHQSALKENRQRAYDDFHAVAEDAIASGVTTAKQLGIQGGSNGGLLVSVAYTQRPELYGAVICQVPLADMRRYHKLLAGASWMGEYGDPDVPEQWAYISQYSPYQNIRKGVTYPKVFFATSTKDDRVHPAHARKMAARMAEYNHPIYYYENIDGGHAGVANLKESAYRAALFMTYLNRELKGVK
jgi:prolyl oligopeptidase